MFEVSKIEDISVLHLYGEVTLLEVEMVQQTLDSLKRCQYKKFLVDLAMVDHVHFQAVRKWAREATTLRMMNGDLKLVNTNDKTKEILRFCGADQCLEDYSSLSEALLSFLNHPLYADNNFAFNSAKDDREELKAQEVKKSLSSVMVH